MFRHFLWVVLGIFTVGQIALGSLQADPKILTLEEAIDEVLSANPDVAASAYQTEAARARIPQAKALEDPMVGVMFEDVPFGDKVTQGEAVNYRFEQKIPFPGKRYFRGKGARFDAEVVSEASRGRVADVLLDLKKTYYEVYRIDRSLEVNRENQRLLKQLLGSAETSYAAGQTNAATPLKAGVELTKLKNEELQLIQQRITHEAHLKALLNRSDHEEIQVSRKISGPSLKQSLEEIYRLASEARPELKAVRAMEKRERARLTSARQSLIPDFSLGFEYNQRPGIEDAWTGTAMVNLPIFFWGKNRGAIKEARSNLKATEAEKRSREIHTLHEIEEAYSAAKTAEKVVRSYQQELLPRAKTNLGAAQTAYAAGQVDFLTLIDAARTYRELQTVYYESEAELGKSFAVLARLVGREL